ncbi:MAG: family 16 glycosylhydrolase [Luteolibacter sp.]
MHRSIPAAFFLLSLAVPLPAQTMPLEQAQALRKEAETAGKALDQVSQTVATPEVRTARGAVGRITDQLDKYITEMKSTGVAQAPDDIYQGGKKYPPAANVQIDSFDVPVGATVVHVPVTLDKPSPNTVIAHVRVFDGDGGRANPSAVKPVIFRPGDPLTQTASFNVRGMSEGSFVRAGQSDVPDGGERKGGEIRITAKAGAVNEAGASGRAPLPYAPLGKECYSATGQTIQYDDKGGPNTFSSALSHGRTQVGNGETGYYGTVDMGGFERKPEGLVLSSRRLDKPVRVGSPAVEYPFLATMLSGHRTPESQFKYGTVEWVVRMSNRKGSWPALWLLPTSGWPPEIDVYEGFGYNDSWKFPASLSTNLHGGHNQVHTFARSAMRMKMDTFGLPNTLDSAFHTFAVTVDKEWITMFIDSIETMRYANPFKGETWYPLTNVAVKAKDDSPYSDGSGDMVLRSLKIWRAE